MSAAARERSRKLHAGELGQEALEKERARGRAKYQKRKAAQKAAMAALYQANKEEMLAKVKAYQQTPAGKKSNRIKNWKQNGIDPGHLTWDEVYDIFISTEECEECGVGLVEGKKGNSRCLDHDHSTGEIRSVLCFGCNVRRG